MKLKKNILKSSVIYFSLLAKIKLLIRVYIIQEVLN